jgi:hypothetical protein
MKEMKERELIHRLLFIHFLSSSQIRDREREIRGIQVKGICLFLFSCLSFPIRICFPDGSYQT